MKKVIALLLTLSLALLLCCALAQEVSSPYQTLLNLLDGHTWTLTAAITDAELEEDVIPFETASLTLGVDEDGAIICEGVLSGETVLTARMTAQGFAYECEMIAEGPQSWDWATMPATATLRERENGFSLNLRINGLDHEHITISLDFSGSFPGDYEGEFGYTLMKGSGEIYGLWDVFSAEAGETSTEGIISLIHETGLVGEGAEQVETSESGAVTITRTEKCVITDDDYEVGTATLVRTVTID